MSGTAGVVAQEIYECGPYNCTYFEDNVPHPLLLPYYCITSSLPQIF